MHVRASVSSVAALQERINSILEKIQQDKTLQASTKYSFHIPKDQTKATTIGEKMAMDEMLFCDFSICVQTILELGKLLKNKMAEDKKGKDRSATKGFLEKMEIFLNKLEHVDSLEKFNSIISNVESVQEALDKLKGDVNATFRAISFEVDTAKVWKEFSEVYFPGLYYHFCIHFRRQEIAGIIADQSADTQQLTVYEVKEVAGEMQNIKIPVQKHKALKRIAEMDPDESLPIVLFELSQIQRMLSDEHCATLDFLRDGINILKEGEQKQRIESIAEVASLAWSFDKTKFKQDMERLVNGIKQITVLEQSLSWWENTALLLEGLHLRFYRVAPRKTEDKTKAQRLNYQAGSNALDSAFHGLTGFYKIQIGEIYLQAAANVREKIAEYKASQAQVTQPMQQESQAAAAPAIIPAQDMQVKSVGDDLAQMTVIASRAEIAKIQTYVDWFLKQDTEYKFDADIQKELSISKNVEETIKAQLKITKLEKILKKYLLSKHHIDALDFLDKQIQADFLAYVGSGGGWLRLGYAVEHAELTTNKMKAIQSAKTVTEKLLILVEFQNELVGLDSKTILPKVNNILLMCHHQLLDSLRPATGKIPAHLQLLSPPNAAAASTAVSEKRSKKPKVKLG